MSVQIRNTKELINPSKFKWKCLIIGFPGVGKTTWEATAQDNSRSLGIAACETGEGKGLISIAKYGIDFVEPTNSKEFEMICSGQVLGDKDVLGVDSLSEMTRTFIKEEALSIPRLKGNSDKRQRGVPELDDYGVMGELTRRLLRKLLGLDKHIIVTATMRIEKPDAETGLGRFLIGPDLPGQLFLGAPAMFDTVMFLKTRHVLDNPKDAKSRRLERYFLTEADDVHLAKNRCDWLGGVKLLDTEEIFNPEKDQGTWPKLFNKILSKYEEFYRQTTNVGG